MSNVAFTHVRSAPVSRRRPPRESRRPQKVRYTTHEWATVVVRARACGRPPACYVREVSLGAVPKVSKVRATAALVRDLGRLATTLGEVAALARRDGAGPAAEAADTTLAALLSVVRRLG